MLHKIFLIIRFYIIFTITMIVLPLISLFFDNNATGNGFDWFILITITFLAPINTIICSAIYFLGINKLILLKHWAIISETLLYYVLIIFMSNNCHLDSHSLTNYIFMLLLPFIIIIPLLFLVNVVYSNRNHRINKP